MRPVVDSPFATAILAAAAVATGTAARAAPYPSALLLDDPRPAFVADLDVRVEGVSLDRDRHRFIDDLDGDGRPELIIDGGTVDDSRCDTLYLVPSTLSGGRDFDVRQLDALVRYSGIGDATSPDDCATFLAANVTSLGDVDGDGVGDFWLSRFVDENNAGSIVFGRIAPGTRVDLGRAGPARVIAPVFLQGVGDPNGDGRVDLLYEEFGTVYRSGVFPGRTHWPERIDPRALSDDERLFSFTRTASFDFVRPRPAGDLDGDGFDELLLGGQFGGAPPGVVPGAADLSVRIVSDSDLERFAIYTECPDGDRTAACRPGAVGDVDGDGFDDLGIAATIIHGSPDGVPATGDRAAPGQLTRLVGGLPFNGDDQRDAADPADVLWSRAGDLNGDGVMDMIVGDAVILFGFTDGRPASVDSGALDGTQGFFVPSDGGLTRMPLGDIDGDGVDDLLINAPRPAGQRFVRGRREDGTPAAPVDVRARFGPTSGDILWTAPADAGDITAWEVRVGDDFVARVGPEARSVTVPMAADLGQDPIDYRVSAIGADGRGSPAVIRPYGYIEPRFGDLGGVNFAATNVLPIEGLRTAVYSPGVVALAWNGRPKRYFVYRDGERVGRVQGNTFIERDLEPGRAYTWFVVQGAGPDLGRANVEIDPTPFCLAGCRPLDATYATVGRSERVTTRAGDAGPDDPDGPGMGGEAPGAVGGLRQDTYSSTAAELFWARASDPDGRVVGYEVRRDGEVVTTRDASSFFDDTLIAGVRYTFTVAAIDDDGNRGPAARIVFSTDSGGGDGGGDEGPAAPSGLRADVYSDTAAELFWARPATFGLRYEVRRDGVSIGTTDGVSFFDDAFARRRGATYEVIAIARDGGRSTAARLLVAADDR